MFFFHWYDAAASLLCSKALIFVLKWNFTNWLFLNTCINKSYIFQSVFPSNWEVDFHNDCARLKKKVVNIFHHTWQYNERFGRDAANLTHSSLKIKGICILHNKALLQKYANKKLSMKSKNSSYLPLHRIKGQKQILTHDSQVDAATKGIPFLDTSLNEEYLFHGTKTANIRGIMKKGFSLRYASNGLYGRALYLAESSEKSDQYAGMFIF